MRQMQNAKEDLLQFQRKSGYQLPRIMSGKNKLHKKKNIRKMKKEAREIAYEHILLKSTLLKIVKRSEKKGTNQMKCNSHC